MVVSTGPLLRLTGVIEAHVVRRLDVPSSTMRDAMTHLLGSVRHAKPQPVTAARDFALGVSLHAEIAR